MPKPEADPLAGLREEIARTDEEILALIARRLDLARKVGEIKLSNGLPIQDYRIEKLVLERNLERARALRLPPGIAEEITKTLIDSAVVAQDERHRSARQRSERRGARVLVVGGAGGMGRWLASYFDSFGCLVSIDDPHTGPPPFPRADDLESAARSHDIVVLAAPIDRTAGLLQRIIGTGTGALVFDICSLKSPLYRVIEDGLQRGLRIASVHPMFGPEASVLTGRNIVFCRTGERDHAAEAQALFEPTTAQLISVPLERHDRIMGYVLGLSHMVSLVFGRALATSGFPAEELRSFASTTFTAQSKVSEAVSSENPELYFEIQSENATTAEVLEGFRRGLAEFHDAVASGDRDRFRALMESGRAFFER